MDESLKARDSLVNTLELTIENLRQINIIVQNFQPQTQSILNQKIQSIVTHLQTINTVKDCVAEVEIPMEVVDFIDSGRNPQLFNKERFDAAVKKNAEVKKKIDDYRRFKVNLMHDLQDWFPNVLASYRAIRNIQAENQDDSDDEDDDEKQGEKADEEEKVDQEEKVEGEEKEDVGAETPAVVAEEK